MEWTNMIDALYDCGSKTEITIYWRNQVVIRGFSEGINETCDCTNEEDGLEYYMCVMRIIDIVQLADDGSFKEKIGDLIELSVLNEPMRIEARGKGVIWEKQI